MNPILREYILKGLFLGLWTYLALLQPADPDWPRFLLVILAMILGLSLGLIVGAITQIRRGYKPAGNWKAFPLVVLLESPFWIYLGLVGGLAISTVLLFDPKPDHNWLVYCAIGGLILGYGFHQQRQITNPLWRLGLALLVGALIVYLAVTTIDEQLGLATNAERTTFGLCILIGLPFFYLLTFCGEADESEIEIASLCAGLGIGLHLLGLDAGTNLIAGKLVFLAPVIVYVVYATRILPGLRVFKHTLRGYSALTLKQYSTALACFKRALRLSPKSEMALEGMWAVHQQVDVTRLPPDDPLLNQLDYGFCLDQASGFLFGSRAPTAEERAKSERMLDLVERQKPLLMPRIEYLRTILATHAKQFDTAAASLTRLLDPGTAYDPEQRKSVLFAAWELALRLHPELVKRVGEPELSKPGRRMEAIAAVERQLAASPDDPSSQELKEFLYSRLSEGEFLADAASGLPTDFNYDYVEQLGLALIDYPDPAQCERGMAFLRMAGRGLPQRGPGIFHKLAEVYTKLGHADDAYASLEQVKRCGVQIGHKSLDAEQRKVYFQTLRRLTDEAEQRGDFEGAIADMRLYLESGTSELASYRKIADLYEKQKDALNALLMTETALTYDGKDRDLLERKDRYYYSVEPERLAQVKDRVERWFDVDYCSKKAKSLLDAKDSDADLLDWALHLCRLAKVLKPEGNAVRFAEARCQLRKGERDEALKLLEDIRESKPGSGDENEAWFQATRMLGDLYLNELNRPDLAVHCFLSYRDYSKSGADTLYSIARSYEASGDIPNAIRFYDSVTAYDQHPKYWDAQEAVRRLKAG